MTRIAAILLAGLGGTAVALPLLAEQATPAASPRTLPSQGYLGPDRMPDSIALLAPPPSAGSPALKADRLAEQRALRARGSARWDLARGDADLWSPSATSTFACAAGLAIGPTTTPRTDQLLRKVAADLGRVSAPAKQRYARPRPFEGNAQPICTPEMDASLRSNGSYPSGHSTIGYGWALILADLLPARRAALLARGLAFGDSRRVCNVHFRSDVAAGQALAAPVIARLRTDAAFLNDLTAARAELRAVRTAPGGCAAERAALAASR